MKMHGVTRGIIIDNVALKFLGISADCREDDIIPVIKCRL